MTTKYDGAGNLVEEAYFDPENKPAEARENGVARATKKYNERGQPVEMRRYGKTGTPLVSTKLPYQESVKYSDSGIMTEGTSYFLTPEEARSPLGEGEQPGRGSL